MNRPDACNESFDPKAPPESTILSRAEWLTAHPPDVDALRSITVTQALHWLQHASGLLPGEWDQLVAQCPARHEWSQGDLLVLIPAFSEPICNLLRAVEAARVHADDTILLLNWGVDDPESAKERALQAREALGSVGAGFRAFSLEFGQGRRSVSTARQALLALAASRAAARAASTGAPVLPRTVILMTDADCAVSTSTCDWLRQVFLAPASRCIAAPMLVTLEYDADPLVAEGIIDDEDLKTILIGELARSIAVAEGALASHREQRRWIGMGMAFTLQSALAIDGYPCGWHRREDHYLGAMMEALERAGLGVIVASSESIPQVVGLVRGSLRTAASLAVGSTGSFAEEGLDELRTYGKHSTVPQLLRRLALLPAATRASILVQPSTRLLLSRLELCMPAPPP